MRLFPIKILKLIIVPGLLVIPLIACQASITTANLRDATIATALDEQMRPLDNTTVFSSDTPAIYCSVQIKNSPFETQVVSEWIYVSGEAEVTDYVIDTNAITVEGDRYIGFSLSSPDEGWPRGDYKLVLYIDGRENLSVPFSVQ